MTATACFTIDHLGDTQPQEALYAVLASRGAPTTVFVEGRFGEERPDAVADVVARGYELGMHGWAHEAWAELDAARERDLAVRSTEALTAAADGVPPVGFRAPGGARSSRTSALLRELGYRYDASLGDGMRPDVLEGAVAQVPFQWEEVDGFWWLRPEAPSVHEVRDAWLRDLEGAAAADGLFVLICHAFITGASDERLAVLDDVVRAAMSDTRVRVTTLGALADELLTEPRLSGGERNEAPS